MVTRSQCGCHCCSAAFQVQPLTVPPTTGSAKPATASKSVGGEDDPDATVGLLIADRLDRDIAVVEFQAVVEFDGGNAEDHVPEVSLIVGDLLALKVDIAGRAAGVEGGPESLERVDLEQLIGWPPVAAGEVLQIEVGAAGCGRSGRSLGHSRISKAFCSAGRAFGK